VTDDNGNQKFLTERAQIDAELSKYWQTVFTKKELKDEEVKAIQNWLDGGVLSEAGQLNVPPQEDMDSTALARKALLRTNNSAAGPDGVPYAAYRRTADISSIVLGDALQDMYYGGGAKTINGEDYLPEEFNYATMVCLPKKAAGVHPQYGDFYTPENTRPLSIVNTDNRISAIAGQIQIEKAAKSWVSDMQQGFIKGRSMVENTSK
jgi:hypothetical protein